MIYQINDNLKAVATNGLFSKKFLIFGDINGATTKYSMTYPRYFINKFLLSKGWSREIFSPASVFCERISLAFSVTFGASFISYFMALMIYKLNKQDDKITENNINFVKFASLTTACLGALGAYKYNSNLFTKMTIEASKTVANNIIKI